MKITPQLAAEIPWVTRLPETQDCSAHRWSHMPVKALRDPDVKKKYECKNRARWQYAALSTEFSPQSGVYCWPHFLSRLYKMNEHTRLTAWLAARDLLRTE